MIKSILKRSHTLTTLVRAIKSTALKRQRHHQVKEYLASHPAAKLQLGSGSNLLPGWLNTDGALIKSGHVYLDITQPFPFADATFEFVFLEHTIEHIHYREGLAMLREIHRVLKPDGIVRLTTPNLKAYLRLFDLPRLAPDQHALDTLYRDWILPGFYAAKNYIPLSPTPDPVFVLNDILTNYEHRFVYTFEVLRDSLLASGFSEVVRSEPLVSTHAELTGLETHGDEASVRLTMALEATK